MMNEARRYAGGLALAAATMIWATGCAAVERGEEDQPAAGEDVSGIAQPLEPRCLGTRPPCYECKCSGPLGDQRCEWTLQWPPPIPECSWPVSVQVSKSGSGTGRVSSSPSGIDCGPSCGSANATFWAGTQVTLTASPSTDSRFVRWQGACTGSGSTCNLGQVSESVSVTAVFDVRVGTSELGTVPGATELAAYDAGAGRYQHVIAGTAAGALTETWFPPIGHGPLPAFGPQVALAGYYTPFDSYQHVISANADGTIWELYWNPGFGIGQGLLWTVPGAVSVGAYYAPSDGYQHVIVGTSTGEVREIYWKVGSGLPVGSGPLPSVSGGIVSVAGYYAANDGRQHVIVGTRNGDIVHTVFGAGLPISSSVIANVPNLVALTAYYSPLDARQHVVVAGPDGTLHEYRYANYGAAVSHTVFASLPNTRRLAGYNASDGYDHVIALVGDGRQVELFTKP